MMNQSSSNVVLVNRKPRPLGNFSIETSFRILLESWSEQAYPAPQFYQVARLSSGILNRIAIHREVKALQYEVIHVTGDIYYSIIGIKNRKVIITIHDLGMVEGNTKLASWIKNLIWFRLPMKSAHHVIAVSERTKEDILSRIDYPPERISVIPSVISTTYSRRAKEPNNHKPRLLHIGLADNKNLERHAAALEGLDVKLRIIGEPSQAQHGMLQRRGIDYSATSRLTEAELQQEYAQSDLLLFCSTLEGFGMPIIEAQTIGLPVITSAHAPMDDTAGDGAYLVNPLDVADIRRAVKTLIEDEGQRKALIEKGLINAERFSAATAVRRHAEVYAGLMAE